MDTLKFIEIDKSGNVVALRETWDDPLFMGIDSVDKITGNTGI